MSKAKLFAIVTVVCFTVGGAAVAGILTSQDRSSGADAVTDPMAAAQGKFHQRCRRATRRSGVNDRRCKCLAAAVSQSVYNPFEFKLASDFTRAVLTNRKFRAKARLKSRIRRIWKDYEGKIPFHRANSIWRTVRNEGIRCARTVN